MSAAEERVKNALHAGHGYGDERDLLTCGLRSRYALTADPDLAQDIEDGAALRRLAAVVPDGWEAVARFGGWHKWPMVEVWDPAYPPSRDDPEQPRYISSEATLAAAADACRVALEEGR